MTSMAFMAFVSRLKPYVQIGVCLSVATALVDLGLNGLSATPALGWLPKTVSGTGYLEDNRERVANAVRESREDKTPQRERLAAIVGISNVRQGINLDIVREGAGRDWQLLGLGGAGLGVGQIAQYADLLISSELRPDLVIIGLGLHQLVDTRPKPGAVNVGFMQYLSRADLRNAAIQARNSVWLYSRQQDVSTWVHATLLDARAWLFRRFEVGLPQAQAGGRSPWRDMLKADWPERFSAATLLEEEQFFRDLGVFETATYENSAKSTARLIQTIGQFRDRGAHVIVLLMPEHSTLWRQIPGEALKIFTTRLNDGFPNRPPSVVDFREAMDDSDFVDLAHLNSTGSRKFSRTLAERVRESDPASASRRDADPARAHSDADAKPHRTIEATRVGGRVKTSAGTAPIPANSR
jgi:hypothetical protein